MVFISPDTCSVETEMKVNIRRARVVLSLIKALALQIGIAEGKM